MMETPTDNRSVDYDFVVLGGSPGNQNSGVDILQQLTVESMPIQHDVESLIQERALLSDALSKNKDSMKKVTRIMTTWQESQEQERAQFKTEIEKLKAHAELLQCQVGTLEHCLKSTQEKLEYEIAKEFELQRKYDKLVEEFSLLEKETWNQSLCQDKSPEFSSATTSTSQNDRADELEQELQRVMQELAVQKELNQKMQAAEYQRIESQSQNLRDDSEKELSAERRIAALERSLANEKRLTESLSARLKEHLLRPQNDDSKRAVEALREELDDALHELQEVHANIKYAEEQKIKDIERISELETLAKQREAEAKNASRPLDDLRRKLEKSKSDVDILQLDLEEELKRNEELQKAYDALLKTWQDFESKQPVILGETSSRPSIDSMARQSEQAELMKLRDQVTRLTVQNKELTARENALRLRLSEATARPIEAVRPKVQSHVCPLCSKDCKDQTTLIQHASICQDESATV